MGQFVIAAYKPRPGKDAELIALVREHLPVLRDQGLATDFPPLVMRADNGTIVEIFEWKSLDAIDAAHKNEKVQALWARFGVACDYESLANLDEAKHPFAHFTPVPL